MNAALPRLRRITGEFGVAGDVKIRPADLYVSTGYRQPGIVLVGDAFATTCPVTGTGTDKVFTDVAQLCNVHIPAWLATEGMGEAKIASFYDDPVKQACDAWSMAKAFSFRKVTIDNGLYWRAQRWARFLAWFGEGTLAADCATATRRGIKAAALTPPRRHPHRRHLHCRRRPDRPHCAACGPGRPRACDRRRWRRATAHASRARSPCRLKSR